MVSILATQFVFEAVLTSIGIAREVARPLNERAALEVAAGDCVAADGAEDGGVAELGLGGDDL